MMKTTILDHVQYNVYAAYSRAILKSFFQGWHLYSLLQSEIRYH